MPFCLSSYVLVQLHKLSMKRILYITFVYFIHDICTQSFSNEILFCLLCSTYMPLNCALLISSGI